MLEGLQRGTLVLEGLWRLRRQVYIGAFSVYSYRWRLGRCNLGLNLGCETQTH